MTARQAAVSQISHQQVAQLGVVLGMILRPELRNYGSLADVGLGLLFLKYSRDHESQADDQKVADVYAKKGAKVFDMDEAIVDKWRAIARDTAWKDYAKRSPLAAELIKLAEGVNA